MKIAVPYENGNVFQHFGKSTEFKMYQVEDNRVISSELCPTLGMGHGAIAAFLTMYAVDTVLCGGIGGGAQMALAQSGIRFYPGVSGNTDQAVAAFLAGTLQYSAQGGCDHHHGEGEACDHCHHEGDGTQTDCCHK